MKDSIRDLRIYLHKGGNSDTVAGHNDIIVALLNYPEEYLEDEIFALRNQMNSLIEKHNLDLNKKYE